MRFSESRKKERDQLDAALFFRKKTLFNQFLQVFYNNIELKKQKMIAIKHYAKRVRSQFFSTSQLSEFKDFSPATARASVVICLFKENFIFISSELQGGR